MNMYQMYLHRFPAPFLTYILYYTVMSYKDVVYTSVFLIK